MKNTLIKRIFAVMFAVMIAAAFAGCNNQNEEESSSIPTESETVPSDPLVGQWRSKRLPDYVYTFNSDGSGQYDMAGKVLKMTYTTEDGKISLNYLEEGYSTVTLNYILDGDTLNIKDSYGKDTFYERVES